MRIGKWDHDAFVAVVKDFHGHVAPGVIIGGYMVEMARRTLPEGILYDAVSETVQCLPDAIQLLTPCTVGNGWLKVYHFGIYALSLYDKYTGEGTRVRLNVEALMLTRMCGPGSSRKSPSVSRNRNCCVKRSARPAWTCSRPPLCVSILTFW